MGVLQLFDRFYEAIPAGTLPAPGHLYWVPTPNVEEVPKILDVKRSSATEHEITDFEICEIGNHHFGKKTRLPIKRLALGDTEELVITKAKKRLAVVLASITTNNIQTLPKGQQQRLAKHVEKNLLLSCSSI
jgi:hypothetical protein